MKTAIIKSKNDVTGLVETEGKAILLNVMDRREGQGFWELKLIGDNTTHCRWVDDESITESEEIN
jgi:hypothetical protein